MTDEPEGYRIPLRTSLTRPILMGGAPRTATILNAGVGVIISLGLQQPHIGIPLWLVLQAVSVWATARDPWFIDVWPRHLWKPVYFAA